MQRAVLAFLALIPMLWSVPAAADVQVHFQSFTGSLFGGRYPHTFVIFEGELANGKRVNENYGFTAKKITPAILNGPVEHDVTSEKRKYIKSTNRHFTITISDAKYHAMKAEIRRWKKAPGKYYDLDKRNCIHFVGKMAQMNGIKVTYPKNMLRDPRQWLNHIAGLNPHLNAKIIK